MMLTQLLLTRIQNQKKGNSFSLAAPLIMTDNLLNYVDAPLIIFASSVTYEDMLFYSSR